MKYPIACFLIVVAPLPGFCQGARDSSRTAAGSVSAVDGARASADSTRAPVPWDSAQARVMADSARFQATRMMEGYTHGNLKMYLRYTYPKELARMQMTEFRASCRQQADYYKQHGVPHIAIKAGEAVSFAQADSSLQCYVPMTMQQRGYDACAMYMIGFSKDEGQHWLFLGASKTNRYNLWMAFPEIRVELFNHTPF